VSLAVAHAILPAQGESVSGDAVVVRRDGDATLIAVIDVLGHGYEAAKVASLATKHLDAAPLRPATDLMMSLHEALRGTRGAAAAICVVRGPRIDGCGVGNVEVRVQGTAVAILLTPGIIGQRMHRLRSFEGRLVPGDRLVCFSDGISSQVQLGDLRELSPRDACGIVMQRHRRKHDDASVLIADVQP
jgi:negative regulator of sigma-B (phosphoserine phosphatase)